MNYTVRNLLVASALMLLGILAVTSFIRSERQELSRGKQEVQVLVATKDIPPGTSAKELEAGGYVETMDVLREDAPARAIGKLSSLKVEGKWLTSNETVYTGEILSTRAFDSTSGLAPTHQIRGNERLFAVPVPSSSDAAGLVRQGDHVDIMAAIRVEGGNQVMATVIARDIEIVETPQSLTPKGVEVEAAAPSADGDTKLYVLKATDTEMANIKYALANADDDGLMFSLRPSTGDTESKIPPIYGSVIKPDGGVSTQVGPDPAVR